MSAHAVDSYHRTFVKGIVSGIGWAIGASIGFTIFVTFLGGILSVFDGLPVIGNLIAPVENLIENSQTPKGRLVP